jgi:long-chain acyl-CoA synthetase
MLNYHYQYLGIGVYYAENIGTIGDNLKEIKADGMTTVPRLLEGIHDKIVSKGKDLSGIKKRIFFWALGIALKFDVEGQSLWYKMKYKIAYKLVFEKWRQALGGNLRIVVCGGSALQVRLLRLFWAMGVYVIEGYGLTETSPVISCNTSLLPNVKFGTVGKALDGITIKIDDTGEILCKGPNVMMGYYKDEAYTKEVIDAEGWFHTGDIGQWVDGDFLKITDRKKEIFKNSGGKYIAPQLIENKCKESIFIEQLLVVGENEKFAAALISPNFNYLHFWALKHKIHYRDNTELLKQPEVIARFQREITQMNKGFSSHEQIKKFRLVPEDWTSANGALSPTLKLKRKFLYEKYDALLKEMYSYAPEEVNRAIKS